VYEIAAAEAVDAVATSWGASCGVGGEFLTVGSVHNVTVFDVVVTEAADGGVGCVVADGDAVAIVVAVARALCSLWLRGRGRVAVVHL
jgi:hypothetical protein